MIRKLLFLNLLFLCLVTSKCLAQETPSVETPSIAIRTDSQRDSLIFRIKLDGKTKFRLYFEDRLQAEVPPFLEKYFAIEPQRKWACVGLRETAGSFDVVILGDCEKATHMKLEKLYKASDIPVGTLMTSL